MSMALGLREWGPAELWAALRGAVWPGAQATGEQALTVWFSQHFGAPALLLNSGSNALQLALQLLAEQQPGRDEVVLPALACPALSKVLHACRLTPRYADIGPDLNTPVDSLRPCLGPRTLAVIMVHAYGHAADSAGIRALCDAAGVALIDDAAQRIEPASGLGRSGDFGIFSFAQSKNVVCGIDGSGGVLLINRPRHVAALTERWQRLPVAGQRRLAWLEFALGPVAPRLAYYLARWRRRQRPQGLAPAMARIAGIDASIAQPQLASLEARRERRRELLQAYQAALCEHRLDAPQLIGPAPPAYLARLMLRLRPEQRAACRAALAAQGIASRLPYQLPAGLAPDSCPQARSSAAELLELPLPAHWTRDDVNAAARCAAPFGAPPSTLSGALACNITGN